MWLFSQRLQYFPFELEHAAKSDNSRALKAMVKHWKISFNAHLLDKAIYGCVENVKLILENSTFSHEKLRTTTETACKPVDTGSLDHLLSYIKLDVDNNHRDRRTAVAVACAKDNLDLIERVFELADQVEEGGLVN